MKVGRLRLLLNLLGAALVLLILLWMGGVFDAPGVAPGRRASTLDAGAEPPAETAVVERVALPETYEAVGTVRSRTRATVSAQLSGVVVEVGADAGSTVERGDLLARIDDQEIAARVEQARSALAAARAEAERARAEFERTSALHAERAATAQDLEAAQARRRQADAGVAAAEQRVREAEIALGYARVTSPLSGVVAERAVEPGDLAWPGRALFEVHDPRALRLEADVREGLVRHVEVGAEVDVTLTAIDETVRGRIAEVVPSVDPRSRSFLVRVDVPWRAGLYPGMFGRLRLVVGEREAVLVPAAAVRTTGQLTTVRVRGEPGWRRRYVTVGRPVDAGAADGTARVEVLSGLTGGETVGWDAR